MRTITREGYSKSFTFDDPEYFEEHQDFEEIEEGVYEAEIRGKSALVIYDEAEKSVDIIGQDEAVRGIEHNHRQALGANYGFNNGVFDHYEPRESFENEETIRALEEFGVQVDEIEQREEEVPVASD